MTCPLVFVCYNYYIMSLLRYFFAPMFLAITLSGFLVPVFPAKAQTVSEQYQDIQDQGIIFAGICDSSTAVCDCRDSGKCTLDDILQFVVNIGIFVLGISGSVILLIFFYGGILWITARGKSEVVQSGKDAMVGAVIGLIIILGAYAGVTLMVSILKTGTVATGDLEDVVGNGADSVIDTQ